tara:strand:+ start:250270 stop:250437 length:168 start_codon:yes stop_codon:yes gene_type:complete
MLTGLTVAQMVRMNVKLSARGDACPNATLISEQGNRCINVAPSPESGFSVNAALW